MAISTGANVPAVSADDIEQARQTLILKRGRPSLYSPEVAAEICMRLEEGETITSICKDPRMPMISAVNDWRRQLADFATAFTRARLQSGASLVDQGRDDIEDLARQVDAEGKAVKPSMADIRLAEIRFKAGLEVAKCYDRDQFGNQQKITADIQVEHTVGGIIELISGQSKPLVIEGECTDHVTKLLPEPSQDD